MKTGIVTLSYRGGPNGSRTRVTRMRTWRPRPLDDGTNTRSISQIFALFNLVVGGNLVVIDNILGEVLEDGNCRIFRGFCGGGVELYQNEKTRIESGGIPDKRLDGLVRITPFCYP